MAKEKYSYRCSECGSAYLKWVGRCTQCNAWDSLTQESPRLTDDDASYEMQAERLKDIPFELSRHVWKTGVGQFDRLLGGGIVASSVGLLGGTPGVGKSTLILQMISRIGKLGKQVLYVSGEESESQIKQRSLRLQISEENIHLLSTGDVDIIIFHMEKLKSDFVVIDSIQTMSSSRFPSVQGSPVQVRECASLIHRFAKHGGAAILLIGHVTKDGSIAGPKVLEHLVDYVLYLEAVPDSPYRYVYPVKNRYGSIYETGVFKMTPKGLAEVQNINRMFNVTNMAAMSGISYFISFEGSRMVMSEVQALVNADNRQIPLRQTNGIDRNRLLMLVAIIQKHLKTYLGNSEIYINFAGGFKNANPTVDMPVIAAILSSRLGVCFDIPTLFLGEASLTGRFSLYSDNTERLSDVAKLGFKRLVVPESAGKQIQNVPAELSVINVDTMTELSSFVREHSKKIVQPNVRQPNA